MSRDNNQGSGSSAGTGPGRDGHGGGKGPGDTGSSGGTGPGRQDGGNKPSKRARRVIGVTR